MHYGLAAICATAFAITMFSAEPFIEACFARPYNKQDVVYSLTMSGVALMLLDCALISIDFLSGTGDRAAKSQWPNGSPRPHFDHPFFLL